MVKIATTKTKIMSRNKQHQLNESGYSIKDSVTGGSSTRGLINYDSNTSTSSQSITIHHILIYIHIPYYTIRNTIRL